MAACGLTLAAAALLPFAPRVRSDLIIVDDFNIFLLVLTTFIGFTTSVYSASYIGYELETGRLTPTLLRFYHASSKGVIRQHELDPAVSNATVRMASCYCPLRD
jgi:hydrogenase-4 component F